MDLTFKEVQERHYAWVESLGWHNKTHLEALALVASEVGEAINECRGEKPTEEYATELADIILRVLDEAKVTGVDICAALLAKMQKNEAKGNFKNRRV